MIRYLLILSLLFLCACAEPTVTLSAFPQGVMKFRDGDTTCYLYYSNSISCVKDVK